MVLTHLRVPIKTSRKGKVRRFLCKSEIIIFFLLNFLYIFQIFHTRDKSLVSYTFFWDVSF